MQNNEKIIHCTKDNFQNIYDYLWLFMTHFGPQSGVFEQLKKMVKELRILAGNDAKIANIYIMACN